MTLTSAQKKAIKHYGSNSLIIACAGSGKTEVIARKIAFLLKTKCKPKNIVAFTFTDKAAAELKDRVLECCREELGNIHGLAEMYIGTIHAFCLDLLKTEVPKYLKFDVLNEIQQSLFIDRHSQAAGLTNSTDLKGKPLKRYRDTRIYRDALSILRESEVNERQLVRCSMRKALRSYETLLDQCSYFDYSSIMKIALDVIRNSRDVRKRLSKRIKYIIVDEYQDVNWIQEAIVESMHKLGAFACVVGDDDQTIYQWRGSNVQGILKFSQRYPSVNEAKLQENFRSSEGVIETARVFIEQNKERLPKKMKPMNSQDYESGDIVALSFNTPAEEARYIAKTIKSLRGIAIKEKSAKRGISWSDMAILLRSVRQNGEPITQALDREKVPYVVVGMNNLFDTVEAEIARRFFYFMASRSTVRAAQLENFLLKSNLGLKKANVKQAIRNAKEIRGEFTSTNKRNVRYGIQRVFLNFLEDIGVREDQIPNGRGEIVFYNLGKFSQVVADFETIHYHSRPIELYDAFADFLAYQAEDAYPEGWQDNQYVNPDAVRIMTVHQAKGMQWPVVFVPALLRNRFPGARIGGRNAWHLIPRKAVKDQLRYEGTLEDERRLFYVALTRSQKFLHLTWAPIPGKNNRYVRVSEFWDNILVSKFVKRRPQCYTKRKRLKPTPRKGVTNVVFTFSDLKYFFECPYQFKLKVLYGFNPPIREELGFGQSLHNALAEVHAAAIGGAYVDKDDVPKLVENHLHVPFANPALKQRLEKATARLVGDYIEKNQDDFPNIEFFEKQINISLSDGVSVVGRIDLVRRKDTNETTIVDLKSNERAQPEEVTEQQLHTYALGYEELTGRRADYVEIYELDKGIRKPRSVDEEFIIDVKKKVGYAAGALRQSKMSASPSRKKCGNCDYNGMCASCKH